MFILDLLPIDRQERMVKNFKEKKKKNSLPLVRFLLFYLLKHLGKSSPAWSWWQSLACLHASWQAFFYKIFEDNIIAWIYREGAQKISNSFPKECLGDRNYFFPTKGGKTVRCLDETEDVGSVTLYRFQIFSDLVKEMG